MRKPLQPLLLLLLLLLASCSAAGSIASDIAENAPLICPEFAALPGGAQACSGIAAALEAFFEAWAVTHPQSATAAYIAASKAAAAAAASGAKVSAGPTEKLVRVGTLGVFPRSVAAELVQHDMAEALDDWLKVHASTRGVITPR